MEPRTIVGGVIFVAKAAKVSAVIAKVARSKFCAAKSSRRAQNTCSAHFKAHLVNGKVHMLTDKMSNGIHDFGHNLFTGDTPVGKGLENIKGTPQNLLGKDGITKSDIF